VFRLPQSIVNMPNPEVEITDLSLILEGIDLSQPSRLIGYHQPNAESVLYLEHVRRNTGECHSVIIVTVFIFLFIFPLDFVDKYISLHRPD